jgi:hypothetical protein
MKSCPNCYQTFFDETYNFCLQDGSWLIASEEPEAETVVSREVETVISYKNLKVNPVINSNNYSAVISDPVVAINIAQQYPHVKNATELYEVTRGLWRLNRQRAERAQYAFAVFRGEIKEVYEVERWEAARFDSSDFWVKRKREQGEEINPAINEGRYQFVGQPAPEIIRMKYVGNKMPVAHGQNPIRYFNC